MAERTSGATPRRDDTRDPRASRTRALKILFQAEVRGEPAVTALDRLERDAVGRAILDEVETLDDGDEVIVVPSDDAPEPARPPAPIDGFTRSLVVGVGAQRPALDALIERHAHRWTVSRMPVVDRCVLRLAVHELQHEPTPPAVVIDEAVRLAKSLSTDDSGRFVNGVLEAIRRELATERA